MNLQTAARLLATLSTRELIVKGLAWIRRTIWRYVQRSQDRRRLTYLPVAPVGETHNRFFDPPSPELLQPYVDQIVGLSDNYLKHRFNLLGSGWVKVHHGMTCIGVEGHRYEHGSVLEIDSDGEWLRDRVTISNLPRSCGIWRLIDGDYIPIDWHLDFKSGYRWDERTWYRDIRFGHLSGVDVKVPWELARMQHLPMLAWAYLFASDGDTRFEDPQRYVREFRNQILDFIATNPPRYGVNWQTTMDVAIRVANWLVAYDLFLAQGAEFDDPFLQEFTCSIRQHGEHIIRNLEWADSWRSNHYLANIVGLLFVGAYLPGSPEINTWLAFALQELSYEILAQFYPDGSNFEASTSYHRLSAEMVVYAMSLALALPPEKHDSLKRYKTNLYRLPRPLPDDTDLLPLPWTQEHFLRIEKMAEFTMNITRPSGQVIQVGDNDSGRFLKLAPSFTAQDPTHAVAHYHNLDSYTSPPDMPIFWDEEVLNHKHLVAAINGLFGRDDFQSFAYSPETALIGRMVGQLQPSYLDGKGLSSAQRYRVGEYWDQAIAEVPIGPHQHRYEFSVSGRDLLADLQLFGYPDFGLYIFRSQRLYLVVRCGSIGQAGNGGHAHNDQLSIELAIDGEDKIRDPGTYLYTALPEQRQMYRSVQAHFAPRTSAGEPGDMSINLFSLGDEARAHCLYFGYEGFIGQHVGYGDPVFRVITLASNVVTVEDVSAQIELVGLSLSDRSPDNALPFSPAYGVKRR